MGGGGRNKREWPSEVLPLQKGWSEKVLAILKGEKVLGYRGGYRISERGGGGVSLTVKY